MAHKIQMNPKIKDMRLEILKSFENNEAILKFVSKLPKQDKAEMVYRFHVAGIEIGKLCAMYGISPGYQRELRQLNEDKWKLNLLNSDEEFLQYLEGLKQRKVQIKYDSPEELSFVLIMYDYIMKGGDDINSSNYIEFFLALSKRINENNKGINQEKTSKNAEVHPPQSISYIPEKNPISIQNDKGMMIYE